MIKEAVYLKDYQLKILFEDGTIKIIDLENFILNSGHPSIYKFKDLGFFKQFRIEYGTICWGNNEFDINPLSIYNGQYDL